MCIWKSWSKFHRGDKYSGRSKYILDYIVFIDNFVGFVWKLIGDLRFHVPLPTETLPHKAEAVLD